MSVGAIQQPNPTLPGPTTPTDPSGAPIDSQTGVPPGDVDPRDQSYYAPVTGNKYVDSLPQSSIPGVDEQAFQDGKEMAANAGFPPENTSMANLLQAKKEVAQNPKLQGIVADTEAALNDPKGPEAGLKKVMKTATSIFDNPNSNPLSLVTYALMAAISDSNADQQEQLNHLRSLGSMQQQMMIQADVLAKHSHELEAAIGSGKKANTNAEIPINDAKSFTFSTLDKDGKILAKDTSHVPQISASDLKLVGPKKVKGKQGYEYVDPNDPSKKIFAEGKTEQEARDKAVSGYNQLPAAGKGKDNMVGSAGLAQMNSQFNQQLDQLNTLISQGQNKLQQQMQIQQQNYSLVSSVIKTIGDTQSNTTRNLL